jgi:hypothetical protein
MKTFDPDDNISHIQLRGVKSIDRAIRAMHLNKPTRIFGEEFVIIQMNVNGQRDAATYAELTLRQIIKAEVLK